MTDLAMARADKAISAAQRRAERIRVGMHSFIATRREIATAYAERDWVTLGYRSFDEYVDSEFSEARLRLSPEERRDAVAELRRAGMSQRAIGTALGVSPATVNADLATVQDRTVPDRITGTDGREQPASRPKNPGPVDAAVSPPADPGAPAECLGLDMDCGRPLPCPDHPVIPGVTPGPAAESLPTPAGPVEPAPAADAPAPSQELDPAADFTDLDRQLDAEMEGTDQRFRRNFSAAVAKADDIWQFDVDRIAEAYAADYEQAIRPFLDEMVRWCDRVRTARRQASGLRVVGGGAR